MLTTRQKIQFKDSGYLLIPKILSPDQISWLRAFLRPKFDTVPECRFSGDTSNVLFDVFTRYPEMRWLLFHRPTINVLKSLLGDDFVVLRETAAHLNQFPLWHKDTTSQEKDGKLFHRERDYLMVEAGYYLQDNTEEYGGGLDLSREHTVNQITNLNHTKSLSGKRSDISCVTIPVGGCINRSVSQVRQGI